MGLQIDKKLKEKIRGVKLLVLDVDGVLTDGRIIYDSEGRDLKFFDVQDGLGIRVLREAGIETILVTARRSMTLERRAKDMEVTKVYQGVSPKTRVLKELMTEHDVREEEICFVGDDLVDLKLMKMVGFPVAVANACMEVKAAAEYTTERPGGRGAVREVVELILKTQGTWDTIIDRVF